MKTNLTLVKSAFYFLKSINLIKGVTQPVDLSLLTTSELNGLKTQVAYGFINSDEDISDYKSEIDEESVTLDLTPEEPEVIEPEVVDHFVDGGNTTVEEFIETEVADEEKADEVTADPYEGWLKNKVKKELNKRKIEYSNDSLKDDLVLLLLEDDEKSKS